MMMSKNVIVVLVWVMMGLADAQNRPKDYVNAHNVARATVGVGPLVWNETLTQYAREYAHVRSADCAMQHSDGPYGENLAAGSWNVSAKEAVDMWLDEKPLYDENTGDCIGGGLDCRHYTQVMWGDSKCLGCAHTHCPDGWTFITCNYDPPGNYIGERPY
ncbi:basic form of pathogenesis-related protein 1-like [Salvia miltiorrhiza]|uniref:basic form of pathogenesis-related protein 1-like n=1 Tax=Salvia miltiorrhiza TaxID=226208 RepID=UPI0025ABE1E4|nr:basic form of pathogenesis-related protein 1-like [Salvia miltiorrhiza]